MNAQRANALAPTDAADAYDAIADDYDALMEGERWMRQRLWAHYLSVFHRGDHVLDVSCGTGIDTLFLAGQGIRMTGIDISPRMIAQLQAKAAGAVTGEPITTRVLDTTELTTLLPERFDGIISAFAGLNMLADLGAFAADASRLLRPQGRLIVHMLNRTSLWEWLGLMARGRVSAARQLARQRERDFTIGPRTTVSGGQRRGRAIRHTLFHADEAYRQAFAPHFHLRRAYSLGALRPPPGTRFVPAGVTALLGALEDRVHARRPFLKWGRFYVLDMERSERG
ncbi:MAG: class I SAM-dependent methyltransferase [Chloroflexi bacterium]|nr:class I SAM-dependent methyltransferase [Chloroflexota bacterium]